MVGAAAWVEGSGKWCDGQSLRPLARLRGLRRDSGVNRAALPATVTLSQHTATNNNTLCDRPVKEGVDGPGRAKGQVMQR